MVSALLKASTVNQRQHRYSWLCLCVPGTPPPSDHGRSKRILKGIPKNLHCTMCEIRRAALVSLHVSLPWAKSCFTCRANRYLWKSTETQVTWAKPTGGPASRGSFLLAIWTHSKKLEKGMQNQVKKQPRKLRGSEGSRRAEDCWFSMEAQPPKYAVLKGPPKPNLWQLDHNKND